MSHEERLVQSSVEALQRGKIILHPTDTILGLGADFQQSIALNELSKIKSRDGTKAGYVCLAPSIEAAFSAWDESIEKWREFLESVWPGPLTFVYKARPGLSNSLALNHVTQTIAIRVPHFSPSEKWMKQVLKQHGGLIVSTSVNSSGEPPLVSKEQAMQWIVERKSEQQIFIPAWPETIPVEKKSLRPSTIIGVDDEGKLKIFREGAFDLSDIRKKWERYVQ